MISSHVCRLVLKPCHTEMKHGIVGMKTRGCFLVDHNGRLNVGFALTSCLIEVIECWSIWVIDPL